MLSRIDLRGASLDDLRSKLPRPAVADEPPVAHVQAILAAVRDEGDEAVRRYTEEFDRVRVEELRVPQADLDAALADTPPLLLEALEAARSNILAYHRSQLRDDTRHESDGVVLRELFRPVDRAGLYVAASAGAADLDGAHDRGAGAGGRRARDRPVLGAPARTATSRPGILAAAALAGVDEVYAVGGAHAIAAMAYGTETIRPVDVIVGPGNVYVSQAKREVASAGLRRRAVVVPRPVRGGRRRRRHHAGRLAAIDLIVQIEHGPDGLAWLITWSEDAAERIDRGRRAARRRRRNGARRSRPTSRANSYVALVDGPEAAMAVANAIAPEHLQLMTADPEALLPLVRHAGAVFCGAYAPASVGDYMAGPEPRPAHLRLGPLRVGACASTTSCAPSTSSPSTRRRWPA